MKDVEEVDISCLLSPEQVMWNDDELDHEMTDAQRRRFVKCKETNLDKMSIIIMAGLISRLLETNLDEMSIIMIAGLISRLL